MSITRKMGEDLWKGTNIVNDDMLLDMEPQISLRALQEIAEDRLGITITDFSEFDSSDEFVE